MVEIPFWRLTGREKFSIIDLDSRGEGEARARLLTVTVTNLPTKRKETVCPDVVILRESGAF